MNTAIRAILAIGLVSVAANAHGQTVMISSSGTVESISDPGSLLPADLVVGQKLHMDLEYRIDSATGGAVAADEARYEFAAGDLHVTISIGEWTWRCFNVRAGEVTVLNDSQKKALGDVFEVYVRDAPDQFPFAVPNSLGELSVLLQDNVDPYRMIRRLELPSHQKDLNLNEMNLRQGEIRSAHGDQEWSIGLSFSKIILHSTVAVEQSTWGKIKSLYRTGE